MDPVNNDYINSKKSSDFSKEELSAKNSRKISEKFDLSIIGKIDLAEAEKIASEEVVFLTESDLIEGLENFELVPLKSYRDEPDLLQEKKYQQPQFTIKNESYSIKESEIIDEKKTDIITETIQKSKINDIEIAKNIELTATPEPLIENVNLDIHESEINVENFDLQANEPDKEEIDDKKSTKNSELIDEITNVDIIEPKVVPAAIDELLRVKEYFTVKISEEILDNQLLSISNDENNNKSDDKILEKYNNIVLDSRFRFVDDQYLNKPIIEDSPSYNEDPLTERLVKMIEVSDGKLELLETSTKDKEFLNYILEDYTLYNSEKFGNAFKEEIIYIDTDFEFIDNAVIRDDFTKYIHEIDDYFGSAEFLIQSEISEILGLIPDESDYIEEKLFSDYYKKYDLDNEIEFIKPEIDFFRSNYTGIKSLNYFSENKNSLLDSERLSIEEDISSPNAIVFEEDISEIEEILRRNYNYNLNEKADENLKIDDITIDEKILDITDEIIILEDKEKLNVLAAEYPEKHENLIKLLSYLDGLFEKLPEEVIRKFADSEYFELYSKVLKEMGV